MELLTSEDFKNTRIQPEWTAMDYLLEVVRVDQEKMQEQTFMNKKKNGRLKRKLQIQEENNKNKRPITSYPPKPLTPEGLKQHIVENMGGSNCVLVIQKQLFLSDVNPQASRLLIPFSQVESHEFLNESEVERLKNKKAIKACLVEPSMEETEINFKMWDMRKKSMYVVTIS
ncbi:B3 domain-containing protein At2g24670-like [Gossypium hirsutum]|uniref:B3 domain-containing protein At2g24670-like n=1 Tax=Gossypium hirsutum TaxID=3635 RepID=A0ABM2ZDP1_GOSHI|nr:B3 domain-containing protein At2g24670-like [Gossypium hirsutum]